MPGIQTTIINKNSGATEVHGAKPNKETSNVQGQADSTPCPSDKVPERKETIKS